MKYFSRLVGTIGENAKAMAKATALAEYFTNAGDDDKLWAIALLSGRRPKRTVTITRLRAWAVEASGLPAWLIKESNAIVGDLAETLTLVLPANTTENDQILSFWIKEIHRLVDANEDAKKALILSAWQQLGTNERFVFNKLITGSFRTGVSQKLLTCALAQATGKAETELAHRLTKNWHPDETSWHQLIKEDDASVDISQPYPFHTSQALEDRPETLGSPQDWRAEWKRGGIRGQLILRDGTHNVWSREMEIITDRIPELAPAIDHFPAGTVLDGELLVWRPDADHPAGFQTLQARLSRKTVSKKQLAEAPVILNVVDLLEWQGQDIRSRPYNDRRNLLETACASLPAEAPVTLSPQLNFTDWHDLTDLHATARANHATGLVLKRADAPYSPNQKTGGWWNWKLDPLTINAVMIYAQAGSGPHASLFTDFTFAVWNGNDLIPFTKANTGLTDAELNKITTWVRKNTLQRFGPVRQVTPYHVFEIAFDGIQTSRRHKSGISLRSPRIIRWREGKSLQEAATLDDLNEMRRIYD